ncbi:uncharacterized protein [Montipora foliosa]|uniref:uncharacterized protein n=1 Tax=Montipora foliosa TaxID=591990 RepID=UPI0035F197DA
MGFWDSYKSAVHDNVSLSKIDKFNYLRSLLEGGASQALQGLALSSDNYDSALEILEQRFGKTQQIISAHMEEVLKLQPCLTDRPSSLRFLYDKLSVHVRGLSSLGVSSQKYGSLLTPIIMSKLPNEIRLEIARKSTSEVWKIDELLDTIKGEVEACEASEAVKTKEVPLRKPPNPGSNSSQSIPTANALFTTEGKEFQIRCVYCNGQHYSASCMKVQQTKEQRDIFQRNNGCFVCLKTGHDAKNCFKTKRCRHCDGKHHQSICVRIDKLTEQQRTPNEHETVTTTTTVKTTTKGTVLLQTESCMAVNRSNSIPVRVLFDNGSQRSVNVADYVHLEGLELADNFDNTESIDVLIGSDYYWDFVSGDSIKGDQGLTAVNSKFGWLLSGPMSDQSSSSVVSSNLIISGGDSSMLEEQDDELVESLENFWESESVGIIPEDKSLYADRRKPEIHFNGHKYEIAYHGKRIYNHPPIVTNWA